MLSFSGNGFRIQRERIREDLRDEAVSAIVFTRSADSLLARFI
jgi:hypothetical protein